MPRLSNSSDKILEFQCPKCAKRLRATSAAVGKRLKCPGCGQPVKVPGPTASTADDDDWLSLDEPAAPSPGEGGLDALSNDVADTAPAGNNKPASRDASNRSSQPATSSKSPTVPSTSRSASASPAKSDAAKSETAKSETAKSETAKSDAAKNDAAKTSSIFDDDLPELAELESPKPRTSSFDHLDIEGLEELVPPKIQPSAAKKPAAAEQPKKELSKKEAALEKANQQYRVPCPACGTPQYVTVAQQGKTIKCPDCFLDFKIPPPPPGWKPSNKPVVANWTTNLAAESAAETEKERSRSRASADEYLRKAEQELSEEEIEGMYGGDFDTAGFMQRTFGFMFDAMAMAQIMAYALVFALLFALANWCAGKFAEGDKGVALVGVLAVPLLMMMAAFPMFSGAITLLESVANGEKKVREWPGFNIFEHMGELLVFAMAVAVSAFPVSFSVPGWAAMAAWDGWRSPVRCCRRSCCFPSCSCRCSITAASSIRFQRMCSSQLPWACHHGPCITSKH